MTKTAILVDAEFFLKRSKSLYSGNHGDATFVAKKLHSYCLGHISGSAIDDNLYRIFVYDCPPLLKKAHKPISRKSIDFSKTDIALFRTKFHEELKSLRKVALRLGRLSNQSSWMIKKDIIKKLLSKTIDFKNLTDDDFYYDISQKGVDMKIGLDIASLSYKKQIKRIILISGDSDFVPAAKLARREGIDFVLDSMQNPISPDLLEHIDGLGHVNKPRSTTSKNNKSTNASK